MRLTNNVKHGIIASVSVKLFSARVEALDRRHREFGDALYEEIYSEKDRAMMDGAPEGAFISTSEIKATFAGYDGCEANRSRFTMSKARRMFHQDATSWEGRTLPVGTHSKILIDWLEKIASEGAMLGTERRAVLNGVKAILAQATTDKALLKIWPEGAEYLPQECAPTYLPAVQSDDLNNLIKAMAEKAKEAKNETA